MEMVDGRKRWEFFSQLKKKKKKNFKESTMIETERIS